MSPETEPSPAPVDVDVAIVGAGLAGLCLARQLLLEDEPRTIAMIDRRSTLPPTQQKVGEATVQMSGYYYARVLGLEDYLLREHYPKYNLRFYWKTPGRPNDAFEDYSHSYLRPLSNICTYQLDRNTFEGEVLRRNLEDPRFTLFTATRDLQIEVGSQGALHLLRFAGPDGPKLVRARWLVDASGRGRFLARQLGLMRKSPIQHGTAFLWVDGLLDIERLTGRSARQIRLAPERSTLGHTPLFLATNHFMGDGFWFWVIPLHDRTSLGLVYDASVIPREDVATPEKLVEWVCREFPLFARDLPRRRVAAWAGFRDFAHDCQQVISADRWAMAGEAGRFTDPLYSPGGDLISIHNTLIADAIRTDNPVELVRKAPLYERVLRAAYEAYVPSFATSYNVLGDQEAYALKYTWELAVYFGFYVFPFINDLFTDRAFLLHYLTVFSRLGPLNHTVQALLSDYARWKRAEGYGATAGPEPNYFDFYEFPALRAAERTFYRVGLGALEAREVLGEQLGNLEELARFAVAWVAANVAGDPELVRRKAFVAALDPTRAEPVRFDPAAFRRIAAASTSGEPWTWSFDPFLLRRLQGTAPVEARAGVR